MKIKKLYRHILRININRKNRKNLKNKDFSIIASNCIGGIIYHELGLQFKSPTINMYLEAKDFVKFCRNLEFYLKQQLEYVGQDNYPIVQLNDIKLYCVHYKNFEDIKGNWEKRKQRINFDNLYFMMSERDGCTYEDIVEFDNLPYKNKVIFVHKQMPEIKSAYYIKDTEVENDDNNKIISLTEYKGKYTGKRYIDEFDYISFLNKI